MDASATAAKASLNSKRSTSLDRQAGFLEGLGGGARRLGHQTGVGAGDHAVADDPSKGLDAMALGRGLRHHHHRRCPVGDLGGVAGRDAAVPGERRSQARQRLHGRARPDALVGLDEQRLTPALRDLHRDDLGCEHAVLGSPGRPFVRRRREGVLSLPGHGWKLREVLLAIKSHGLMGAGVLQARRT